MQREAALADQRALLEEERSTLCQRLAELGFGQSESLTFDQNFADSSQVTAERAEVEALATSLQESLDEVDDALRKMDAGTYGTCEGCGQPIAAARLEAKLTARLCMECASKR
ncbi:MAG TPA: TraR/DksA C4-type zinc finger protein [Acidimicrobiales bacterium]|nr:TraR/DksA C4-type zinc finger protein [Acidimicrobiales bacterium]